MRKLFIILCCAFVLLNGTSCDEFLGMENTAVSQESIKLSSKVEKLVQQARQGEIEAYDALAVCYRDGDGVKQSDLNMMAMYLLSCRKSGKNIKDVIESLDVDNPIRLLIDVLGHPRIENAPQEAVARLREVSPADALIYDAFYAIGHEKDTVAAERFIEKAVTEGSDMACIIQIGMHELSGNKEKLEQALYKYADRFPVLYVRLGEMYMESDSEGHLEQAVKYFTYADNYGMLTVRGARGLSAAYRMLDEKGEMKYDRQEMERLEKLAQ